jgi:hypothetical protein
MWNRYSVRRRSRRSRPDYRFERALTFDLTVGSPSKIIEEFQDAVFLGVDVESLLGEAEVSSLQTRVQV